MSTLSIGQVAREMGISASTIRYYEKEALIPIAPRESGRRSYDESIFDHLTFVHYARKAGFGIAEIKPLVRGLTSSSKPGDRWRSAADEKLRHIDEQLAKLQAMRSVLICLRSCQCPNLRHFVEDVRAARLPDVPHS